MGQKSHGEQEGGDTTIEVVPVTLDETAVRCVTWLSVRVRNLLAYNGIVTLAQADALSADELLSLRNFGKRSLAMLWDTIGAIKEGGVYVEIRSDGFDETYTMGSIDSEGDFVPLEDPPTEPNFWWNHRWRLEHQ